MGQGYTETNLEDIIKNAGGRETLKRLGSAENIAEKLFWVQNDLMTNLFNRGYNEVGQLHAEVIWQLAYDLECFSKNKRRSENG